MLDHLYATLVEDIPERGQLNIAKLSEQVLSATGIAEQIQRDYRLEIPLPSGTVDVVSFDYVYRNGAVNLMQRVSLTFDDERSWDAAHAAAWSFDKAAAQAAETEHRSIALVRSRTVDDQLTAQLELLRNYAETVELRDVREGAAHLRSILGLHEAGLCGA